MIYVFDAYVMHVIKKLYFTEKYFKVKYILQEIVDCHGNVLQFLYYV